MTRPARCVICGRFAPSGATYCAECAETVEEAENPREKGDDDAREYADPRDYRDGRE